MAAPQFSEWKAVRSDGSLPEDLLPCSYLQYRWSLVYIWTPDDFWFGMDGGQFKFTGDVAIGDLVSNDVATFLCFIMGIAGVVDLWTYYPASMATTGPASCPTFGGDQLDWQYDPAFGDAGFGIDQLFVVGWLVSPIYQIDLAEDAAFTNRHWRPQYAIEGSCQLQVRTAPGGRPSRVLIKDEATGNRHSFRISKHLLLDRRYLSAYDVSEGVRAGLVVTAGAGIATVSAGQAFVGGRPGYLPAASAVGVGSGDWYVWLRVTSQLLAGGADLLEVVATAATVPAEAAFLLAVVNGSNVDISVQGVVVAMGADDFGAVLNLNGKLTVEADMGAEKGVVIESGDGGITWQRQG